MEERTQIKFSNPDIDGSSIPQTIHLEQEDPIEGESESGTGETFTWHKWLCKNNEYFMASGSLDAMLKAIPNKVGQPLEIAKNLSDKGGYPFFTINGMSSNDISKGMAKTSNNTASSSTPSNTSDLLKELNAKIDTVIMMLKSKNNTPVAPALTDEDIPF